MEHIYRIRNSEGLFSTGGSRPKFTEKGKIWKERGHVTSHLLNLGQDLERFYKNCTVVKFQVIEEELETFNPLEWKKAPSTIQNEIRQEMLRNEIERSRINQRMIDLQKEIDELQGYSKSIDERNKRK